MDGCNKRQEGSTASRPPHVLVVSGVWPHTIKNREAANVVSHEITNALARSGRFELSYCVINAHETNMPLNAEAEVNRLRDSGVRFLDPIMPPLIPASGETVLGKCIALISGRPDKLIVGTDQHDRLVTALGERLPDAVLVVWSEQAGYLVSQINCLRFNYAGNPDHKVLAARTELREKLGSFSFLRMMRDKAIYTIVRLAHLKSMRRFDLVWNVAANDAQDYMRSGVKAEYLQNMWPHVISRSYLKQRDRLEQSSPLKIVGNVGNLSATGNSFGLLTLVEELIPKLKVKLGEGNFEVHIFGGSSPHPSVEPLLDDPHIRVRGYVDDLDKEILSAPVFLVANNSRSFKVGHTRFLHAWSLGACVVGFSDSSEAMPEVVDGKNALLGDTPEDVANLIVIAANNHYLRRQIAAGGVDTLKQFFSPQKVTATIIREIESQIKNEKIGIR